MVVKTMKDNNWWLLNVVWAGRSHMADYRYTGCSTNDNRKVN